MITNFKKQSRKDDVILLTWIVMIFLIVAWFVTPPGNKFMQICFWGNNTRFFISKLVGSSKSTEYVFHRNNAVYLARMYPNKKAALKEMDKAIVMLPSYASNQELEALYKDRAEIKLYLGDHKGALSDFMNSGAIGFNDTLKVALLFKQVGNYKQALSYCNSILERESSAYSGFACLADIYQSVGRPDIALNIWNLAIDRNKNNPRPYVDRALVKKSMGDLSGYDADLQIAKEFSPSISTEDSLIKDTLYPKVLNLSIR